ncbi:MAG: efflux RND transporter periplasmic adaptor subunit [Candidatus Omnitrophica bacterium]|nr:efflux RND transporter periplasmic adaptor subunit [Candidatus Omnitrophota bacterium]MCM8832038.1 efflux RND transporter periplasmic adaptor subunit [Candidatus Omnitrophota bacterium]
MRLKYFILLVVFIFSCCNVIDKNTKKSLQLIGEEIPVKVMKIKPTTIRNILDYVGNIKAKEEAIIYPKVSGKIVKKVKEESEPVEKEDVIAYIDRDEVGLTFQLAPVTSSLKGLIGKIFVDLGQQVHPQTPIALVVDIDKVKVNLDIPEKYLDKVKLGLKAIVKVDAYPDKEFIGNITKIVPIIDFVTRTFSIEILVDNPDHLLKPGMLAKVTVILEEYKDALVVLKEAVLGKEPDLFVYVVKNNKALTKKVKLGLKEGPYYQIKEGIDVDDLVVIMGQQKLYDSAVVSIQEENNMEEN